MTDPDEIRTAAEKLRALATAASTDTDGTPTAHWNSKVHRRQDSGYRILCGDYLTRADGRTISWPTLLHGRVGQSPALMHTQHAEYAAAMGPTVGLALADLLDDLAHGDDEDVVNPWALALARQINGDEQ